MFYIGGIARYAWKKDAALTAINFAFVKANGQALVMLVTVGVQGKDENRKIFDR
jgi:hypothetical protein